MISYQYLLIMSFVLGTTLTQCAKSNAYYHKESEDMFALNINNIIQDLVRQHWDDEESICLQKTLDILESVKNRTLWATWVWDSMQHPTGVLFGSRNQLGNFDECLHPPWAKAHPELLTQHCLAHVKLTDKKTKLNEDPYTSTDLYISALTKHKMAVNELNWGLCLPSTCKANSIKKFARTLLNNSHLRFASTEATINIQYCQSNEKNEIPSFGFYATLVFIGSMALLTFFLSNHYNNHYHVQKNNNAISFYKAFSISDNYLDLTNVRNDEILTLNSLRFLSAGLIVYVHMCIASYVYGYKNSKSYDRFVDHYKFYLLFHGDVVVDTFFLISGILLMKSFFASNKPINIVKTLIKRYCRLTYITLIVILFNAQLAEYCGGGPWMPELPYQEISSCKENWWRNLLLINNYQGIVKGCLPITWSNACDFHFTIVGTLLYWLYQKNKHLAIKVYLCCTIASIVLPTIAAFCWGTGPIVMGDLESWRHVREIVSSPFYMHSEFRIGAYLVGLAFGYLLSVYIPASYKKFSQTFSTILFMFGVILALSTLCYGGYLHNRGYNLFEAALYVGTNRFIWAIAIGIIIVSCEYGNVPLITRFLRWHGFSPLSKLSFCVYLTHLPVLVTRVAHNVQQDTFSFVYSIVDLLGVITFCLGLAFLMWLLFEAPMNNVVSILLKERSKTVNGRHHENENTNNAKKVS